MTSVLPYPDAALLPEYGDPLLPARFWARVYPCPITGCWLWGGGSNGGYGYYWHTPSRRSLGAHVVAYRVLRGKRIRKGRHVDHLCRQRACVNPAHLQAVTIGVNVLRGDGPTARNARKLVCDKGHPLTPKRNAAGRPWRTCLTCQRDAKRARRAAARGVPVETIGAPIERCKRDHPLVGPDADVLVDETGRKHCRPCRRIRVRGYRLAAAA